MAMTQPDEAGVGKQESRATSATLSVIVMTYNEERRLQACLESASWADEVIVVDGYSTDGTAALARGYTDHVYSSDLLGPSNPGGYSAQRNFALGKASGDWIFFLDADERITPELRREIEARLLGGSDEGQAGYRVRRWEHFFGVLSPYTHGAGWHNRVVRRGGGAYNDRLIHETMDYNGSRGDLQEYMLHFSKDTVADYVATMNRYTSLEAELLARDGARLPRSPLPSMLRAFSQRYFFMRSYREGIFGLLMSVMFAVYQYLVWAKHWEARKNSGAESGAARPSASSRLIAGGFSLIWRSASAAKQRLRSRGAEME